MTKNDQDPVGDHDDVELADCYYPQLLRVARSAGLDLSENRKKNDLLDRLAEAGVERVGYDKFEQNGEPIDLLPPQTSSGASSEPRDKTVLYCLTRKETTEERVEEIREALEGIGYDLQRAGSENDKYAIVLPASEQGEDGYSPEDAEEWVRSQGPLGEEYADEALHQNGEYFEEFESEEEVREDFEEFRSIALDDMTREELYELAQDLEVEGRSDMSKSELVDAVEAAR